MDLSLAGPYLCLTSGVFRIPRPSCLLVAGGDCEGTVLNEERLI